MASNSSVVVPRFLSEGRAVHYFTLREEDYPVIERWLAHYGFEYGRFFASFINYLTKAFQHKKNSDPEYATLSPFLEIQYMPLKAQEFLDALIGYAEKFEDGARSGEVDLKNGRVGTNEELEKAQKKLASILYSSEQRKQALAKCPEFGWLLDGQKRQAKKAEKTTRRLTTKVMAGIEGMNLD